MISWFISHESAYLHHFLWLRTTLKTSFFDFDSWRGPFYQRAFASGFILRFLKISIFEFVGSKNLSKWTKVVRSDALNGRFSRYLRHINVKAYLYLVVIFFGPQKGPNLLDSDIQVGLTTHRVYLGVSGWVSKLW